MPIFGRSSDQPDPGEVTRVSATPDISGLSGPVVVPPAAGRARGGGQRRARRCRRACSASPPWWTGRGPGRSSRNVRKWLEWIGMALIVFGFVAILLGWYGASPTAPTSTRRCPTSSRAACSASRS